MVKDIKYIIKRIIIGTGIAIALMCIKGNFMLQGHALTQAISSWQMPAQTQGVNNTDNAVTWYTNDTPFAYQGDGELLFTFAIYKINGTSTAPNVAPRFVRVHTGGDSYVCYIGSSTLQNSTFNGGTYSAICPMHIESAGVTSVVVALQINSQNDSSQYAVSFNGLFTWKRDTEYTLLDAINNKLGYMNNNDIINNNNSNTQNIINNQDSNTQDVIDNQNSNTDKEIESQKVCTNIDKSIATFRGYLSTTGENVANTGNTYITDFINLTDKDKLKVLLTYDTGYRFCFYDDTKTNISCIAVNTMTDNQNVTIPSNTKYVKFTINTLYNRPQFEICKNGNQAIVNSQQDINNTLNNSDTSDPNGDIANMNSKLASNNSITQLLTLPITLFQNVLNNINGSCSSYNLGSLYGHNLTLPCINLESILGSTLWGIIDILISGLFILSFRKKMVDIFNHMSSLNDRGNELE